MAVRGNMPYRNAEDRKRRLLDDLARVQRVFDAGAMTPRQYGLAHARIETALVATDHGTADVTEPA